MREKPNLIQNKVIKKEKKACKKIKRKHNINGKTNSNTPVNT